MAIIDRDDAPAHIFNIRELDLFDDLLVERLAGPWFRLGAWTLRERADQRGVGDVVSRQSVLLAPGGFAATFDKLEAVGNVFSRLGRPGGVIRDGSYGYAPFHQFEFFSILAEPLVFDRFNTSGHGFFINPDVWMFLELEEKTPGRCIWWDPRRGVDALVKRVLDDGNLEAVEIRTDYLLKYLQARQMSLVVGHYRHLHFFNPPEAAISAFVTEDAELGSPGKGAKAILQNWGLRQNMGARFLQRRLHLWFEIIPPEVDIADPWAEAPSFDPYTFTLPTTSGLVAPARWKHVREQQGRSFIGHLCDFMDRVYFRQEVLTKYEGAAGFEVMDNGSVSCRYYWGLTRSTHRIGNELLSTAIGDFAQGVPFEEWPHWKQYSVEPPSLDTAEALAQEPQIWESVNSVVNALQRLNGAFAGLASSVGVTLQDPLWRGSLESLAGRQLKWVYPAAADDDEFLKRATLASTLFLDGLLPSAMRALLNTLGQNLHQSFEKSSQVLGSRNLLQRTMLVALLIEQLEPALKDLALLVKQAEGNAKNETPDLQAELETSYKRVRADFAPIAFLYDLRIHGGLAHPPNKEKASAAAASLGLPRHNWHRTDYLSLLKLVADSLDRIREYLDAAAAELAYQEV